jgi:hypothetical protein
MPAVLEREKEIVGDVERALDGLLRRKDVDDVALVRFEVALAADTRR